MFDLVEPIRKKHRVTKALMCRELGINYDYYCSQSKNRKHVKREEDFRKRLRKLDYKLSKVTPTDARAFWRRFLTSSSMMELARMATRAAVDSIGTMNLVLVGITKLHAAVVEGMPDKTVYKQKMVSNMNPLDGARLTFFVTGSPLLYYFVELKHIRQRILFRFGRGFRDGDELDLIGEGPISVDTPAFVISYLSKIIKDSVKIRSNRGYQRFVDSTIERKIKEFEK